MPSSKADIYDEDIVDAYELRGDGTIANSAYLVGAQLTSIVNTQVTLTNDDTEDQDDPLSVGDVVEIVGAAPAGADGTYTILTIDSRSTFTMSGSIVGSYVGGTATFAYPSGATNVGINPATITGVSANNLQQGMEQLASLVGSGGVLVDEFTVIFNDKQDEVCGEITGLVGITRVFVGGARELNHVLPTGFNYVFDVVSIDTVAGSFTYSIKFGKHWCPLWMAPLSVRCIFMWS